MNVSMERTVRAGYADVSVGEVAALRRESSARLVDVREPHEFTGELGHIAGAELVPLATVGAAVASWDRERPLIMICRSGGRSGRAAAQLAAMGFKSVHNMSGGMLAWNDAKLPVER